MTTSAPVASAAPKTLPLPHWHRVARAAAAVAATSMLGGCAIWSAIFNDPPPSVPVPVPPAVAPAPQGAASGPIAPQALPPAMPADTATAAAAEPAPAMASPVSSPAPVSATELTPPSPLPKTGAAAEAAPAHGQAAKGTTAAVPTGPGFYINVGLFAVPTNGSNAVGILRNAGQPVFSDMIESKKGQLTRVRVGPFAKRAEADAAAKKIKALKLDAIVFERK